MHISGVQYLNKRKERRFNMASDVIFMYAQAHETDQPHPKSFIGLENGNNII